ncbi:MAG: hypothetical protein EOM74_03115 [Methanomicrobia archaeon]|nr:hypothetical protein [Methanomicrobia archaeon]
MNFNTFLLRLGIDPDNFKNMPSDPIAIESGFIYEVAQRTDQRECPFAILKTLTSMIIPSSKSAARKIMK